MKSKEETLRDQIPSIEQVKTRYRPIQNDLLIIPLPEQSQTAAGIILPDRSKIVYDEGHIVAMGEQVKEPFSLGDCVTWNRTDANVFEDEGSAKLVLLNANNVLMKISVDLLKATS